MIFGWLEHGRTDRWVLVDALVPWPGLHNARESIRLWAAHHNRLRALEHSEGPRRCPWPCKVQVKEDGAAELRIWPCAPYGEPREWTERDGVWRGAMTELAELVATDIACPVTLTWMGGTVIEQSVNAPGLRNRGFLCWGKGEREAKKPPWLSMGINVSVTAKDVGVLPQGDAAWH
jgi:hypothetical protein